jgi:nitroreductase
MRPPRMVTFAFERLAPDEMRRRAAAFAERMHRRRSVREFAPDPVPRALIERAVAAAASAPSGAHLQPWRFVAVSDPETKRRIRQAAEREERISYEGGRMPEAWRRALAPLGTDWHKPYLETVPWLVVVFAQTHRLDDAGRPQSNYYVKESVGIACGLFIAALHDMGLATLTHTPSPMGFLSEILRRPRNEKPYILFPVGYPAAGAQVPDLQRKPLAEVLVWHEPGEGETE